MIPSRHRQDDNFIHDIINKILSVIFQFQMLLTGRILTVCTFFFIRRLRIIIFSKNFLCAELGSNQQSPILSRTEVSLRILLLRQLKATREIVAPIVRVLLYYPPPRANPGRLYHLSTDTYISKKTCLWHPAAQGVPPFASGIRNPSQQEPTTVRLCFIFL